MTSSGELSAPLDSFSLDSVSESELFARVDEEGVRDEIVRRFTPLCEYLVRKYASSSEPFEDLRQVALFGLVKAIDRFDPDMGNKFSTFATPTVIGELKRYFRDHGWSVRVPRGLKEDALRVRDGMSRLRQTLGRQPQLDEIAEELEMDLDAVVEALDVMHSYSADSLDAPVGSDEGSATLGDLLPADTGEFEVANGWAELAPAIAELPQRERNLIYLRFFKGLSQTEIADQIGVSQMHVSRLLRRALDDLREKLVEET